MGSMFNAKREGMKSTIVFGCMPGIRPVNIPSPRPATRNINISKNI